MPPPGVTLGIITGAVVLVLLLIAAGVLVFTRQRKRRDKEKLPERVDENPVYATYEVHDDPVAEVRSLKGI